MTDTIKGLKNPGEVVDSKANLITQPCDKWKVIGWAKIGEAKMEEGVTIAKVPDWLTLKPEMMRHLISEHEKLGRTLTEEETVTLLRGLGFEISETK